MHKKQAQGEEISLKANIKDKYIDITEDELLQIEEDYQKLVNYLQEKYGMSEEKAKKEANILGEV